MKSQKSCRDTQSRTSDATARKDVTSRLGRGAVNPCFFVMTTKKILHRYPILKVIYSSSHRATRFTVEVRTWHSRTGLRITYSVAYLTSFDLCTFVIPMSILEHNMTNRSKQGQELELFLILQISEYSAQLTLFRTLAR